MTAEPEVPAGDEKAAAVAAAGEEPPHYLGHRERLRRRLLEAGAGALADYELVEFLLFGAKPRGDVKPLAKKLLARFGSLGALLAARPEELKEVPDVGEATAALFRAVNEAARRMMREEVAERPVLSSGQAVVDYCRLTIGQEKIEQFHLLFLDSKNRLIADERQQRGTIDHTPVYPREVVKRALELSAAALILVHNHPSGDPTPSRADIEMTKEIVEAAATLGIKVHDHIIVGRKQHTSFKSLGLL